MRTFAFSSHPVALQLSAGRVGNTLAPLPRHPLVTETCAHYCVLPEGGVGTTPIAPKPPSTTPLGPPWSPQYTRGTSTFSLSPVPLETYRDDGKKRQQMASRNPGFRSGKGQNRSSKGAPATPVAQHAKIHTRTARKYHAIFVWKFVPGVLRRLHRNSSALRM